MSEEGPESFIDDNYVTRPEQSEWVRPPTEVVTNSPPYQPAFDAQDTNLEETKEAANESRRMI